MPTVDGLGYKFVSFSHCVALQFRMRITLCSIQCATIGGGSARAGVNCRIFEGNG